MLRYGSLININPSANNKSVKKREIDAFSAYRDIDIANYDCISEIHTFQVKYWSTWPVVIIISNNFRPSALQHFYTFATNFCL